MKKAHTYDFVGFAFTIAAFYTLGWEYMAASVCLLGACIAFAHGFYSGLEPQKYID